jgi:hypothetical protein
MATFMPSTYAPGDRRKKVVTYGKSSRLPSTGKLPPVPPPTDDAPLPERPRKHTATANDTLKKSGTMNIGRAPIRSPDIFDVPSEDEFIVHSAKASKRLPTKRRIPEEGRAISNKPDQASGLTRQATKTSQLLHKAESAETGATVAKRTQKPMQPSKAAPVVAQSRDDPPSRAVRRGKTPLPVPESKAIDAKEEPAARATLKTTAVSRATAPAPSVTKAGTGAKVKSAVPSKKTGQHESVKRHDDLDIFDMPSSGDEAHIPTPRPPRRAALAVQDQPGKTRKPTAKHIEVDSADSDGSNTSIKRKRKGSVCSTTATKPNFDKEPETSLPQRSRKFPKKENGVSPGHNLRQVSATVTGSEARSAQSAVNKPKRTRLRTVPVLTRAPITKGQSSPATLTSMLHGPSTLTVSPVIKEEVISIDETMYDIPDTSTTPIRPPKASQSGSTTPRQKALFGSLLGTSPSATPMISMSKLQLTDKKPRSLIGSLSRSKSDVTHNAQAKKTRLIDTLKDAEDSSEEDGSDSDSGRDEPVHKQRKQSPAKALYILPSSDVMSDGMDVDVETAADSQNSQATSGFGARQKLTYAKSRSYLQEANPEDALLMSMDLDVPMGFGSQKRDVVEEDDEEASQVRANHELRKQGQNDKFQFDNEMLIDDIAATSTSSIRRSTMLEFCTKMSDEAFVHQLLDSSLAHQFLNNIASTGEIIFDFAAAVAAVYILDAKPTHTMFDQLYHSGAMASLVNLLDHDRDIQRITNDRKTNLSKITKETVIAFRTVVLNSGVWLSLKPSVLSPRLVALKALDLQVLGLRTAGNTETIIDQNTIIKLVDIATNAGGHFQSGQAVSTNRLSLELVFSILESVSLAKQKPSLWSASTLRRLAGVMPVLFQVDDGTMVALAVKLCMNLTNNRPKACQQFSDPNFVQSLVRAIIRRFELLQTSLEEDQRTATLEALILSLGAMINLTEHSDQARMNVDDGKELIETLVDIFLAGSARAAQVKRSPPPD